jgi:hypothetical protein
MVTQTCLSVTLYVYCCVIAELYWTMYTLRMQIRCCDRLHHLCRIFSATESRIFLCGSLINREWINGNYWRRFSCCCISFYMSIGDMWRGCKREQMNRGTKSSIRSFHSGASRHDGILQEIWTYHRKKTGRHRSRFIWGRHLEVNTKF